MLRIGIFGGTFDPPHIGHLILASEVQYQLRLDRLLWVLTPNPPHKTEQRITPLEKRLEMVQAALSDSDAFELSTVEIDRPPPHYALETVRFLRKQHPGAALIYLMGGDSLRQLKTWHSPDELIAELDGIGVMRRPQDEVDLSEVEEDFQGVIAKTSIVIAPLLDIAGRDIRRRVSAGAPYRYYVHPGVHEIIERDGLYLDPLSE